MSDQDCTTCPSFMERREAKDVFGSDPGAPMCFRHGHILGKPDVNEESSAAALITTAFASRCRSHGDVRPLSAPNVVKTNVIERDFDVIAAGATPEDSRPRNCSECVNMVNQGDVMDELGWPLPLCTVTGRLLFPKFMTDIAKACDYGVQGDFYAANTVQDLSLELLEIYRETFDLVELAKAGAGAHVAPMGDIPPHEYPTDREVTPVDESIGIRAWREVEDRKGVGRPMFAPIFDLARIADAIDRATVPTAESDARPDLYMDWNGYLYSVLVDFMTQEGTPMLVGPPGTGKTEFGMWFAYLCCLPYERISITPASTIDEVFGSLMFIEGETRFRIGRFSRRWSRNGVCVVDEFNQGEPEVVTEFRSTTDNAKQLILNAAAMPHPETGDLIIPPPVPRAPYFFPFFPMNPAWDYSNTSTRELPAADVDRFSVYEVGHAPEAVQREILVRRYTANEGAPPAADLLDKVVAIGNELRAHVETGSLEGAPWGMRRQIAALNKTPYMTLVDAYCRAGADYLDPAKRQIVLDVVRSHSGATMDVPF